MGRIRENYNRAKNWIIANKKKSAVVAGVGLYLVTLENVIGEKWGHDWLGLKQVSAAMYDNFGPAQIDIDNNQNEHDDTQDAINGLNNTVNGLTNDVDGLQENVSGIQNTLNDIENAIYNGTNGTTPVDPVDPTQTDLLKNSYGIDVKTLRSIIREQGVTNVASMLGLDATLLSTLADGEGANNEIVNNGSYAIVVVPNADGTQGQVTTYTIQKDIVTTVSADKATTLEGYVVSGGN